MDVQGCKKLHATVRQKLRSNPHVMTNAKPEEGRKESVSSTLSRKKFGYSKESNDQQDQERIHFPLSNR